MKKLADEIAASMKEDGLAVDLFQVPELLGADVLKAMGAPPKPSDPVMDHAKTKTLADYDGFWALKGRDWGEMTSKMLYRTFALTLYNLQYLSHPSPRLCVRHSYPIWLCRRPNEGFL